MYIFNMIFQLYFIICRSYSPIYACGTPSRPQRSQSKTCKPFCGTANVAWRGTFLFRVVPRQFS